MNESQIHLRLCGKQKNIISSPAEDPAPVFQSAASHVAYNVFEECNLQQKKDKFRYNLIHICIFRTVKSGRLVAM
jgi:hypothetical protein